MDPAKYEKLGKRATDVLSGFYAPETFQLKAKSKIGNNEFLFTNQLGQSVSRTMVGSKVLFENGFQLQNKWNTDRVIFLELAKKDVGIQGARLGVTGKLLPGSGKFASAVNALLRRDHIRAEASVCEDGGLWKANTELTVRLIGHWMLAFQLSGPIVEKFGFENRNLAISHVAPELDLTIKTRNFEDVQLTLHHLFGNSVELANKVQFNGSKTTMQMGFQLKSGTMVYNVSVDSNTNVLLGVRKELTPTVTAKCWTNFEGRTGQLGRIGVGFAFN